MGRHHYTTEEIKGIEARIDEISLRYHAAKVHGEKEEALRLWQTLMELAFDRYLNTARFYQGPSRNGMSEQNPDGHGMCGPDKDDEKYLTEENLPEKEDEEDYADTDGEEDLIETEPDAAESYVEGSDETDVMKQRSCCTPSYYGENEYDIIVEKILSSIESFDPAGGEKLCHLISYAIKRARAEIFQAPGTGHSYTVKGKDGKTKIDAKPVSIDKPVEGKDGDEMGMDEILEDPSASVESAGSLSYDDLVADIINYIKSPGQKISDAKRKWFTLFFTENMTDTAQHGITESRKEKSIFSAMELPYLDFYMSKECRTLLKLANTELKTYGEILCDATKSHQAEEFIPVPIPADVSEAYITTNHIPMRAKKSSRSEFLKDYRAVVAELTMTANQ